MERSKRRRLRAGGYWCAEVITQVVAAASETRRAEHAVDPQPSTAEQRVDGQSLEVWREKR